MRLRQIALVAQDLAKAEAEIRALFRVDYAYADPGVEKFGLANAVFPIGETFLEVVSPKRPGTTAGRLLEKRGGDGGYMVILQVDDGLTARAQVEAAGARIVEAADFEGVVMSHVHPKDIGGAILSLDSMPTWGDWRWGGPDWREHMASEVVTGILAAEMQGPEPKQMADRWGAVLGREAHETDEGWRVPLEGGELRFVLDRDGRGEGLSAFDVAVHDPDGIRKRARKLGLVDPTGAVSLCGTRLVLVLA